MDFDKFWVMVAFSSGFVIVLFFTVFRQSFVGVVAAVAVWGVLPVVGGFPQCFCSVTGSSQFAAIMLVLELLVSWLVGSMFPLATFPAIASYGSN